ncbi:MAG TPA: carboxypeptidase-like regulatory domain-containing protein, partial [Micromonosporaceae bacterium]|nr:carboxypeptidase-like regulatory domain-containing protein [Micromonosporaceae bacterium]
MINLHFAVYGKTGATLLGPLPNNALWAGFGGPCQTENDGDPVVLYDEAADRWMLSQFALTASAGNHQCMAISQTPDPTGAWHRYDFFYHATRVNDYPKYGIWPNAYFMSTNEFAPTFIGAGAVAFEREKMLSGQAARQVYFHLGPEYGGLLPADAEGGPPPVGVPNSFLMFDDDAWGFSPTDRLMIWDFVVDWANPAGATFGVGGLPNRFLETAPFDSNLCNYARNCVPQMGTTQRLDAISDRLMFRAAYRNFGDHASIVLNHTVDTNGADRAGLRWYEVRTAGSDWAIHQQGTYAPDSEHRWMGSAAMDATGNIAIGYSASSSTSFPSIRVAGRLAGDPLGQLTQGERIMMAGTGAQTHSAARWGDYSSMSVDPTDGCTFWFTTEYLTTTSSADWHTRIGSARFPTCQPGPRGVVRGTVTDAATGAPLVAATVAAGAATTVTGSDGGYSFTLPAGTYEMSATAYGYATKTATVTIADGGTATQNFALAALPRVTISGKVTDGSGHGWPLYARIDVAGRPGGPIFTDPGTGAYAFEVAVGTTYELTTGALYPGYRTVRQQVAVGDANVTHNVAVPVDAFACVAAGYSASFATPTFTESFDTTSTPPGWTVLNRTTSGGWTFNDPGARGNLTGGTGGFAIA